MRVLIACEFSGIVRDAFIKLGHDAISCDLLPSDMPGPHYQGDVFNIIDYPFDLAIFHPECTHLAVSGAAWFKEKKLDGRQQTAVSFLMNLERRSRHIPKRVFENPVSILSTIWRKPEQIIQPTMFGHYETKATCLWLYGLPLLEATNDVSEATKLLPVNERMRLHYLSPSPDRWKERSRTYQGIADAMASQWG